MKLTRTYFYKYYILIFLKTRLSLIKSKFVLRIFLIISLFIFGIQKDLLSQQSKLSKAVNYISSYIASDKFIQLKKEIGDLPAVDSIYTTALKFENYNYSEALLASCFATLPYKEVPIVIPLIKSVWNYHLVSANDSIYNLKNENLPSKFFYDTPQNDYGDKDKNAHFFGFAFLAYSSVFFDFEHLIGNFIEVFEEDFKIQSSVDYRDLDVNFYGKCFGKLLKKDKTILPSQVLVMRTLYYFGNPL